MKALSFRRPRPLKATGKFLWTLLLLYPWIYALALLTYYGRACLALGHAPYYNQPDPKALGFDGHHALLALGFSVLPLGLLVLLLTAVMILLRREKYRGVSPWLLILAMAGWGLLVLLFTGPIIEWYLD